MKQWILLLALGLTSGAMAQEAWKKDPIVKPAPSATVEGRFVMVQLSTARADQYLLDTKTGKVWQIVARSGGEGTGLQPVPFWNPVDEKWVYEPR